MWVRLFHWLACRYGTTSYLNAETGDEFNHRLYLFNRKFQKFAGKPVQMEGRCVMHMLTGKDMGYQHNHPWDYFTLILSGGYWEIRNGKRYKRKPGWFAKRSHKDFHGLETIDNQPCVTLFFKSKERQKFTLFKMEDGEEIKDLKWWKMKGYSREDIQKVMFYKTPEMWRKELGRD